MPFTLTNRPPAQTLQKHYLRLIRLWPKDHLRGVLVQDALRKRLETRYLIPAAAPQKNVESNGALVMPAAKGEIDEKEEREQLNALYSLLENRYSKQVCWGICPLGCFRGVPRDIDDRRWLKRGS